MAMKRDRGPDPRSLDVLQLCRNGEVLQGSWPLVTMPRLAEGLSAVPDTSATWTARGELLPVTAGEPELWLQLSAQADASLQCQRCMQPLVERMTVDRRFRFVRNEDDAARLDEELEDDVLALPPRLDLQALLEDELILALPLVPRHAVCPQPLPLGLQGAVRVDDAAVAPHPFAALAGLRRRAADGDGDGGDDGGGSGAGGGIA